MFGFNSYTQCKPNQWSLKCPWQGRKAEFYGSVEVCRRQKLPNTHVGRQPLLSHLTKVTLWSETMGWIFHTNMICLFAWVLKAGRSCSTDSPCNQPPPGCSGSLITPTPTQAVWLWGKDLAETIPAIWGGIRVVLSNFQFLPPAEAKNVPHCLEVSGSVAVGWEQPSEPLGYTLPWISQQITGS